MFALANIEIHGTYRAMRRQQQGEHDALAQDAPRLRVKNSLKQPSSTRAK
jgi:hypothetical protein